MMTTMVDEGAEARRDAERLLLRAIGVLGVRGLAKELGLTHAYVSMLASGKRPMTRGVVTRLEEKV